VLDYTLTYLIIIENTTGMSHRKIIAEFYSKIEGKEKSLSREPQ